MFVLSCGVNILPWRWCLLVAQFMRDTQDCSRVAHNIMFTLCLGQTRLVMSRSRKQTHISSGNSRIMFACFLTRLIKYKNNDLLI